jgi:hypothetical protein
VFFLDKYRNAGITAVRQYGGLDVFSSLRNGSIRTAPFSSRLDIAAIKVVVTMGCSWIKGRNTGLLCFERSSSLAFRSKFTI